eukprot:TRINITY_DN2609_c0_g1_i6.p2 TRINITY_DN2609_c0_g1~~TRINITY_DN2609_c0_g1_i6.p2  ORF type:complete len:105 (+),score=5.02 TRINITY_DN2609_c0_g1_i6:401-715(+)
MLSCLAEQWRCASRAPVVLLAHDMPISGPLAPPRPCHDPSPICQFSYGFGVLMRCCSLPADAVAFAAAVAVVVLVAVLYTPAPLCPSDVTVRPSWRGVWKLAAG